MIDPQSCGDGTFFCGSELARDGAVTVDVTVECQAVIASKLAPTGFVYQMISINF
jgi:hypothetical protein